MKEGPKNFIAASSQATLVTIVGYPFDTVKARMQTGLYNTTWDCFKGTAAREGPLALYRGSAAPWISHLVKRPIQFPVAEYMKTKASGYASNYAIGASTGLFGPIIGNPLQVVKVGMQTTTSEYKNSREFIRDHYRKYGFKGFYKGLAPTIVKDSLFGGSFMGHYYSLRDFWGNDKWYKNFASGAIAHCATWLLFIPIDFVKTQAQKPGNTKSVADIVRHTARQNGLPYMWRGVVPACLRTIPVSGVAMAGYEYVRKLL